MRQARDHQQTLALPVEEATAPASTPPTPPSLQFIAVGQGGRVSNLSKVRSHVSKEYHSKKRAKKKLHREQLEVQRKSQLRPSPDDPGAAAGILEDEEQVEKVIAGNYRVDEDHGGGERGISKILSHKVTPPPSGFVQHGANCRTLSLLKPDFVPIKMTQYLTLYSSTICVVREGWPGSLCGQDEMAIPSTPQRDRIRLLGPKLQRLDSAAASLDAL